MVYKDDILDCRGLLRKATTKSKKSITIYILGLKYVTIVSAQPQQGHPISRHFRGAELLLAAGGTSLQTGFVQHSTTTS